MLDAGWIGLGSADGAALFQCRSPAPVGRQVWPGIAQPPVDLLEDRLAVLMTLLILLDLLELFLRAADELPVHLADGLTPKTPFFF